MAMIVAFAMAICLGQAPEDLIFNIKQMRSHLYSCLEMKQMRPFPSRKRCIKRRDWKTNEAVPVYCKCRLFETNKMICCDSCNEWYHSTCVVVPPQVWSRDNSLLWTCDACT